LLESIRVLSFRERLDREFVAEKCNTLAGLTEILSRGSLVLVLICQSVPDAECEEVIEMVRVATAQLYSIQLSC
jgi:hypothetical protein